MKKYVKPDLYFESFQLDQHIAACGLDLNQADIEHCYSQGDDDNVFGNQTEVKLFLEGNGVCQYQPDTYCYVTGVTEDAFKVLVS